MSVAPRSLTTSSLNTANITAMTAPDSAHTAQCEYVLVAVIQLEQLAYRDTDASTYLKGGTLPAG